MEDYVVILAYFFTLAGIVMFVMLISFIILKINEHILEKFKANHAELCKVIAEHNKIKEQHNEYLYESMAYDYWAKVEEIRDNLARMTNAEREAASNEIEQLNKLYEDIVNKAHELYDTKTHIEKNRSYY